MSLNFYDANGNFEGGSYMDGMWSGPPGTDPKTEKPRLSAQDPQFQARMNKFSARGMQMDAPTLPPQIGQQKFGDSGFGSLGGGNQTNVSLNLQGSATMNPQGANQNRGYTGFDFNPAFGSAQGAQQSRMQFAEGGPVQRLTQFNPMYYPAQQGIGSLQQYQAPDMPPMEGSPQDYGGSPQYAPTTQYNAPAANPMTAGLSSYLKGLEYKAPVANPTGTVDSTNEYIYDPATQTYGARPVVALGGEDDGNSGSSVDSGGYGGDSGEKAGGRIHAYAHGGSTPQGIASLGRGPDTMLVHMTPGEVQGLQRLAMAHGGSLTINPQTGLPEAGFLSAMLPMLAGVALAPMTAGTSLAFLGTPIGAALTVGGISALTSGSLKKGLMAGLGAYGGASLGSSLSSMGTEQAEGLVTQETNLAADLAGKQAQKTAFDAETARQAAANAEAASISTSEYFPPKVTSPASGDFPSGDNALHTEPGYFGPNTPAPPPKFDYTPEKFGELAREGAIDAVDANFRPAATSPAGQALARGPVGNAIEGFKQLGSKEGLKTLGGKLGFSGVAGLAAPLIASAMTPTPFNPPARNPTLYARYGDGRTPGYTPPKYNPRTGSYDPAFYGPESFYTNPTQYGAKGGAVDEGGIARFYPLTGDQVSVGPAPGGLGGRGEKPKYSRKISDPDSGAGIFNNKAGEGPYSDAGGIYENTPSGIKGLFAKTSAATLARYKNAKNAPMQAEATAELRRRATAVDDYGDDTISAAQGGLMNTYAAGGKLLRGPGDGMSDSIPAVIQGANPQRAALADGEFVIPADVVSHLGNGSTEAGSKRLYSMMDKVRKARTGNPKQGKQINPDRFMPA